MKKPRQNFTTRALHSNRDHREQRGFVNTPVYHGSTILFETLDEFEQAYQNVSKKNTLTYGRRGNPTAFALENAMADLENGYGGFVVSSGLAATTTALMSFLKCGDHLLINDSVYSPTRQFCDHVLTAYGVEVTYYDPMLGEGIATLLQDNTKCIYIESPGSMTFEVMDVPSITQVARSREIVTLMDNTWATPYLYRPLDHGVDVSITAATKYIVGHSDAMLGLIVSNEQHYQTINKMKNYLGQCVGPDDIFLGLRGLRTLSVRMEQHHKQALHLATWLQQQPEVIEVLHPAFENCPGHDIWKRDYDGASGLFSFILKPRSRTAVASFLDNLSLLTIGVSWGAYESLILPGYPEKSRTATQWQIEGNLFRVHVGLEHIDDLIADLDLGLKRYSTL